MTCDDDYSVSRFEFRGLVRGDTYEFPFLSEETTDDVPDDNSVWTARDLSAGTFACQMRISSPDGALWTDATVTVDDTNAATGRYVVVLTGTGDAVPGYEYVFDVEYTDGSTVETLVAGVLDFEADVTRV